MSKFFEEIEKLRLLYGDIVNGSTYLLEHGLYVKHLTELDNISLTRQKSLFTKDNNSQGAPLESERLKAIIASGEWSQENEERILSLKYIISDNEKNVVKLIPQQQNFIKAAIKRDKTELAKLLLERRITLGDTAEDFAETDLQDYLLSISLFKDSACKLPMFNSLDDVQRLQDSQLNLYQHSVKKLFNDFTSENIRKIAVLPFFINTFSYCKEDVGSFLRKPMSQSTNYQLLLFSYGMRNINILGQAQGDPPELMDDISPEQVVTWYDQQYSIILGKRTK